MLAAGNVFNITRHRRPSGYVVSMIKRFSLLSVLLWLHSHVHLLLTQCILRHALMT